MAMSAAGLKQEIYSAMTSKGWKVEVATPDGSMTPTSLEDLAEVIATAVVNHITANGLATIPPGTVLVGCTGPGVVPVPNPVPLALAIT